MTRDRNMSEIQRFINTTQKHLDSVFNCLNVKYNNEKSRELTYNIYRELFQDFYKKNRDKEEHIIKLIKAKCKKYGIEYDQHCEIINKAPQSIMRNLMIELSKYNTKNSKKRWAFVAATTLVIISIIFFFINSNSNKYSHGTVGKLNPKLSTIHTLSYHKSVTVIDKSVSTLANLIDKGVLVEISKGSENKQCEVWLFDNKTNEFNVVASQTFVSGCYESNIYMFKDRLRYYLYNSNGDLKSQIARKGSLITTSDNGRFIVSKENDTYHIFDTVEFKYISSTDSKVYSISDLGYLVTSEVISKLGISSLGLESSIINIKAFEANKIAILFNTQRLAVFENEQLTWDKKINFSEEIQSKDTLIKLQKAYLFANQDMVNVVLEINDNTVFQAYDTVTGTELNYNYDTKQSGNIEIPPSISPNNRVMLLQTGSNRLIGKYSNRGADYTSIVDLSKNNFRKSYNFESWFVKDWVIDNNDNEYYLYYSNYSSFKVVSFQLN